VRRPHFVSHFTGVPGIGPKIAAQLLKEFGTLESLLQNTPHIKQNARRSKLEEFREQARLSRRLVSLCDDIPLHRMTFPAGVERVSDLLMEGLDEDRLFRFYDDMGFQEIRRRVEGRLVRGRPPPRTRASAGSYRRPKATVPDPHDVQSVPF
jgi:DNA polymerase I